MRGDVRLMVLIPGHLKEKLRECATNRRLSMVRIVEMALTEFLTEKEVSK